MAWSWKYGWDNLLLILVLFLSYFSHLSWVLLLMTMLWLGEILLVFWKPTSTQGSCLFLLHGPVPTALDCCHVVTWDRLIVMHLVRVCIYCKEGCCLWFFHDILIWQVKDQSNEVVDLNIVSSSCVYFDIHNKFFCSPKGISFGRNFRGGGFSWFGVCRSWGFQMLFNMMAMANLHMVSEMTLHSKRHGAPPKVKQMATSAISLLGIWVQDCLAIL